MLEWEMTKGDIWLDWSYSWSKLKFTDTFLKKRQIKWSKISLFEAFCFP